jgi:hypothetical protein
MFSIAGCGSSTSNSAVCDNLSSALTNLTAKYAQCGTVPTTGFDKNACVDAFNSSGCTDADKTKINSYVACLNNLPTCTVATQSAWQTSYLACASQLNGLSSTC